MGIEEKYHPVERVSLPAVLKNNVISPVDLFPSTRHDIRMKSVQIVGILNVTPNSYHDGGKFLDPSAALARANELLEEGADIIEIGGESTGPKSPHVSEEEELQRVLPVLRAIRASFPDAKLSIDTYKSNVAEAALKEGVMMVNDVTAGRSDPQMFSVVAKSEASLVLMFSKDPTARTTIAETQYKNVVETIKKFLSECKDAAIAAGVSSEKIILDPGMGHFISSDPKYSLEVLANLKSFADLGCPLFVSPSRKSFLAGPENLSTKDRLPGTIAASVIAVLHGASYIRTHDVLEVRRACEIVQSIYNYQS